MRLEYLHVVALYINECFTVELFSIALSPQRKVISETHPYTRRVEYSRKKNPKLTAIVYRIQRLEKIVRLKS